MTNRRRPALERLYQRYLKTEDTAGFIQAIAERYSLITLDRLAMGGGHVARRAAIMAIGFLGDFSHNAILGRALNDRDRGVRLLADSGIRQLWRRDGSRDQQASLLRICRMNLNQQYVDVVAEATALVEDAPWLAEAWNQRALAHFASRRFEAASSDCHMALELNAYHFGAAVGLAHCYLRLDQPLAALENFRRALRLNPDLEDVRGQIKTLSRAPDGR